LNLDRLNYAIITLIPKEQEAKHLKKFRPISLINCRFKIFAKALNNRLIKIADRLISSNQTAFIKGRYILKSVVAAHEIVHEVFRKHESGVILKLDYEDCFPTAYAAMGGLFPNSLCCNGRTFYRLPVVLLSTMMRMLSFGNLIPTVSTQCNRFMRC